MLSKYILKFRGTKTNQLTANYYEVERQKEKL